MHKNHHYQIVHYKGEKERVFCFSCQKELSEKEVSELIKNFFDKK